MAGLVTALLLAHRGVEVLICERGDQPGGKLREVPVVIRGRKWVVTAEDG